jgi:GT2 family glycosyltransferase
MINTSIVIYKHKYDEIAGLLQTLSKVADIGTVFIIDNSPKETDDVRLRQGVTYIYNNGKNLGYGSAHNIAIRESIKQSVDYHLVVNPDVDFEPDIMIDIEKYMSHHPDVGLLSPKMFSPDGELQYQCKRLPSPADLIMRRFLPDKWTTKRRYRYEMRDTGYDHIMEVPYLQGSFMFFRTNALEEIGLFDERFFMYPEDIDITRRMSLRYKTIFYPEASIIHAHQRASYKSLKMLLIHIREMIKYFNKWGW